MKKSDLGRTAETRRQKAESFQLVPRFKRGMKENDLKRRTKAFALRIIRLYCSLTKAPTAQVLGCQVLRSGTSVGANYREAFRARSKSEFIAKMGECLKELEETSYWLELLVESGTLSENKLGRLQQESGELIAIFVTIIKKMRKNLDGE